LRPMVAASPCYRYLYVSRLAAGAPSNVVTALLRRARERNRELGIHGVLLFDGEHFAQLLEGPAVVVAPLARRIEGDDRHVGLVVYLEGSAGPRPLFDRWRGGWVQPEVMQAFIALPEDQPEARLRAFKQMVGLADVA
jgi:Sensors of blue-light using FAD